MSDVNLARRAEIQVNFAGVDITKDGENFTYKRTLVESRYWDDKMYLYPIPDTERYINPSLGQNPLW